MKYCVYTRACNETPYLDFFIEHYVKLGFDKIIILKCFNKDDHYKIPEEYQKYVLIYNVKNLGNSLLPKYDYIVKNSGYDCVLNIDIDEILLLNPKYKNINEYTEEKLSINKNINTFYFRWGMIEKCDNTNNYDFINILNKYNVYVNSHIKSMIKIDLIRTINHPHITKLKERPIIYFEKKILKIPQPNKHIYNQLCSYKDTILIHLHTRSINNLIEKSYINKLGKGKKRIKDPKQFYSMINSLDIKNNYNFNELFIKFKKYIGIKVELLHCHSNNKIINMQLFNRNIYNYDYNVINIEKENEYVKRRMDKENIDLEKYNYFAKIINDGIVEKGRFICKK